MILRQHNNKEICERLVFAEYHLLEKKIVWKEWTEEQRKTNIKMKTTSLMILSFFSVPVIMTMNNYMRRYTYIKETPQSHLGEFWLLTPFVLGVLMVGVGNLYMMIMRERAIELEPLDTTSQNDYFCDIIEGTPFKNVKTHEFFIPWLLILQQSTVLVGCILLMIWVYDRKATFLMFASQLIVLSFFIANLLSIWLYAVPKYILLKKLVKNGRK